MDAWDTARAAHRDVASGDATRAVSENHLLRGADRSAAYSLTRSAVLALTVQDLISDGQFGLLYGPWRTVIENKSEPAADITETVGP
jgi:type IV secretory pathway TrbD component